MLFIFLNYFEHLAHPQMFLQCFYFMILGIYYLVQFLLASEAYNGDEKQSFCEDLN